MVLRKSARRLASPVAGLALSLPPPTAVCSTAIISRRTFLGLFGGSKDASRNSKAEASNPILEKYLKEKPKNPEMKPGGLTSENIFEADRQARQAKDAEASKATLRDPEIMAATLDPDPRSRRRWERKMVIRGVRNEWRLTKAEKIKLTERESLNKSPLFKTSVKKLGALARQIQGKPIEDAIVQMRFSKKKVAQQVKKQLEYARDEAIVKRGMGLGKVNDKEVQPIEIELKDGKRHKVDDRSGIYVDQAWVGRGPYGMGIEYRARGRTDLLRKPYTSMSVILKEEATRIRQHEERQTKRKNRKVWVPLPDRPVTTQRQYYSW